MYLAVGERLGPYEILALIGTSGMGEVYKGVDTLLGRVVAIKVSAKQFSERFERDALPAAADEALSLAARMRKLEECECFLLTAMPVIPIHFPVYSSPVKPYVRGWAANPT